MSDLLPLQEQAMQIKWRYICCIPDLKLRSIGCRDAEDGTYEDEAFLALSIVFNLGISVGSE